MAYLMLDSFTWSRSDSFDYFKIPDICQEYALILASPFACQVRWTFHRKIFDTPN